MRVDPLTGIKWDYAALTNRKILRIWLDDIAVRNINYVDGQRDRSPLSNQRQITFVSLRFHFEVSTDRDRTARSCTADRISQHQKRQRLRHCSSPCGENCGQRDIRSDCHILSRLPNRPAFGPNWRGLLWSKGRCIGPDDRPSAMPIVEALPPVVRRTWRHNHWHRNGNRFGFSVQKREATKI